MPCRHERAIIGLEIYCPACRQSFLPGTETYRFILRQMERAERGDCKRFQLQRRKSYVRHYSGGFYVVTQPPLSAAPLRSPSVPKPVPVQRTPKNEQLGFLSF